MNHEAVFASGLTAPGLTAPGMPAPMVTATGVPPQSGSATGVPAPLVFRRLNAFGEPAVDQAVDRLRAISEARSAEEAAERLRIESALQEEMERAEVRLRKERLAITHALEQFAKERQRYFHDVEAEVLKLALAMAERILHREAELDPLMMAGAVRMALQQVASATEVSLHVAPQQISQWKEVFRRDSDSVELVADAEVEMGACVLHTSCGQLDLSVRAQLQELERGFFAVRELRPRDLEAKSA